MNMNEDPRRRNPFRVVVWSAAVLALLAPWVAMRFTSEVDWGPGDFTVFGVLLLCVCGGYELATRLSGNKAYRLAAGLALGGVFLLIWANLAVGIVGDEGNPVNLVFFAVPAVAVIGGVSVHWGARGMARALVATAIVQVLAALLATLVDGRDAPVLAAFTGCFVLLWLTSAGLFRKAARA
jgi:hypothetical protein